jgi:hypothetical protein
VIGLALVAATGVISMAPYAFGMVAVGFVASGGVAVGSTASGAPITEAV